ncbi:MAG: ATP-binding protein [Verrucomicrobiota bacterium JB022]|nr:ATP-binding protein [Verrucomicrobiota bacterium JB022]
MKSPVSDSVHYDPLQFVVDQDLQVVKLDPVLLPAFGGEQAAPTLEQVFKSINPEWQVPGPSFFQGESNSTFLPWEPGPPPSPYGMRLQALRAGDLICCSLMPALGSAQAVADAGLQEIPEGDQWSATLFMRLKKSENKIKIYSHHFPGFMYQQRADLSFSYLDPSLREIFGLDVSLLQRSGSSFLDLIYEKDRDFYLHEVQKGSQTGERFTLTYRLKLPHTGQIIYLQDYRSAVKSANGLLLGYEGVWLDITRQAVAEKRLSSAGWKESLATLTSGLLHDFKNSMTGIGTLSELYCRTMDRAHPWHEGMTMIRKNALEAQKIVQRMIDLNREEAGRRNYHNLRELVRDQIELVRIVLPKHMHIETQITEQDIPVYLDEVAFRQMVLNLVINSRDASPHDGTITIRMLPAETGQVIDGEAPAGFVCPKDGALIEIADQGHGIPPENLPHVFNPYYTTKEISKGSGLGLYNTRIFIQDHGGEITIQSEQHMGTTIRLFLPTADFTESLSSVGGKHERGQSERRTVIIFQQADAADFTDQLRQQGCEVISFQQASRLLRYLPDVTSRHNLLVLLGPRFTPAMQELARHVEANYPSLPMVHVHPAHDDDQLPAEFEHLLDLTIPPGGNHRRLVMQILDLLG